MRIKAERLVSYLKAKSAFEGEYGATRAGPDIRLQMVKFPTRDPDFRHPKSAA